MAGSDDGSLTDTGQEESRPTVPTRRAGSPSSAKATTEPAVSMSPPSSRRALASRVRAGMMAPFDRLANPGRRERIIGALVMLLGVGLLGGWCGWTWRDRTATVIVEEFNVSVTRPIVEDSKDERVGRVPLVVGLDVEGARQAMVDAGVAPNDIVEEDVPYGGQPGIVIAQSPMGGVEVGGTVTLRVSAATKVPDLQDTAVADARQILSDLGVRVVLKYSYVAGSDADIILSSNPAAGETLGDTVELEVSERASSVYLADLEDVSSECSRDDMSVNATLLPSSLYCSISYDDVRANEYDLGRLADELIVTIGLDDRCVEPVPVVFRVILDGAAYGEWTMEFGTSRELQIPVTNVLRLRLEVQRADGIDDYVSCYAVWGSAAAAGGQGQIDQLMARS